MTTYNKLVRDNVPDRIREDGGNPVLHTAGEEEYWGAALKAKLLEEAGEFVAGETIEELPTFLRSLRR